MKHAEADYIKAGFFYEKAKTKAQTQKVSDRIKKMLYAEASEEEPRRLIEQGRAEASK